MTNRQVKPKTLGRCLETFIIEVGIQSQTKISIFKIQNVTGLGKLNNTAIQPIQIL